VIYAVRFEEADLDSNDLKITYTDPVGLAVSGVLPPNRIVAKARIAPDVEYDRLAPQFCEPRGVDKDSDGRDRAISGNGIIARVPREMSRSLTPGSSRLVRGEGYRLREKKQASLFGTPSSYRYIRKANQDVSRKRNGQLQTRPVRGVSQFENRRKWLTSTSR
jgi:hypothetical protein